MKRVPCTARGCEDGKVEYQSRGPYHALATQPRHYTETCEECHGEGTVEVDEVEDEHVDLGGEA